MAKIFEMHTFRGRSTQASPNYVITSPDFGQIREDNFPPIIKPIGVSGASRLGSHLHASLGAGAKLLPVIAIVWGLYITGIGRKSGNANPKQDDQVKMRATPQPSQPGQPASKPSPIRPVDTTPLEGSIVLEQPPYAVAHSTPLPVSRSPVVRYEATRKKVFGGCTGQLELTNSWLQFRCPDQADLRVSVATIAKANKDGVVLKSGAKYHFLIANHTRGQVEVIFVSWLNRVKQIPQPNRVSSF